MSKKFIKQKRADGWSNLATLLGTGADKRQASQIHWEVHDPQFFEEMYSAGGIPARIVDLVPETSLRHWVEWTGVTKEKAEEINALCESLDVRGALLKSWKWGRSYGGAVCHIVTDTSDPASPLRPGERVIGLRDLSRWDLRILTTDIEYDFGSPNWGMPRIYYLNVQMGSQYKGYPIHWTRMLRFDGQLVPRRTYIRNNYWHDSILNRLYNSIRNYETANDSVAACLMDFNVDVFKMKNLANLMGAGKEALVKSRLEMLQFSKSVINGVMIDADEEDYINVGRSMQGVAELLVLQANRLVAETDIPHTLLLGESPDGSNATGNSTSQQWYNFIGTEQENYLRPKLQRLMDLIVPDEKELGFKFKPLRVLDDIEMAAVKYQNAQTDEIYINSGVLAPEEIADSRFGGETYSMEITIDEEGRESGDVVPAQQSMEMGDPDDEGEDDDGEKKSPPPKKAKSNKSDAMHVAGIQPPEGDNDDFPDEERIKQKKEGTPRGAKSQSVEGQGLGEADLESAAIRGGVSEFEPVNTMVSGGDKAPIETFISQTMSEPLRDPRTDPHLPGPGIPNKPRTILPTRGTGVMAQSGSSPLDAGKWGEAREGLSKEENGSAEENLAHNFDGSPEPARRRAATIIVKKGDKFLMGKENATGRYTLPGGWVEDKESMHQGGVRELAEETGVEVKKLKFLGSRRVESEMNKPVDVSMYEYNHGDEDPRPTGKGDPDKEVSKWEWFSHKEPLSDEVVRNLKHPNNVALDYLGLFDKRSDAEWNESDHPRAEDGKFGSGGGGAQESIGRSSKSTESQSGQFKRVSPNEFTKTRDRSKRQSFLSPTPASELQNHELYVTQSGAGYALSPEKDLQGVFNNSETKGAGREAVIHAIGSGTKTLDCFDDFLPKYYARFGFKETKRVSWDDQYAPEGWDYAKNGRPDVVYMEYPESLSRDENEVRARYESSGANGKNPAK